MVRVYLNKSLKCCLFASDTSHYADGQGNLDSTCLPGKLTGDECPAGEYSLHSIACGVKVN